MTLRCGISGRGERHGCVLSLHELPGNIGTSLTPSLVGLAIVAFPWRTVLLAQLIPGVVMGVIFWIAAPKLSRREARPNLKRYRAGLAEILRNRTILAMSLVSDLRS